MDREHSRLKAEIYDQQAQTLYFATLELQRLKTLFRDIGWYNFELECRMWKYPWPQSVGSSMVMLCSVSHTNRTTSYPIYYAGRLDEAPPIPIDILLNEIELATEYVSQCQELCSDVYEYAPGGHKYAELMRKYLKSQVRTLTEAE